MIVYFTLENELVIFLLFYFIFVNIKLFIRKIYFEVFFSH